MNGPLTWLDIVDEIGLLSVNLYTRTIAAHLGFKARDLVEITSAVTPVARDAFRSAGRCRVEFSIEGDSSRQLAIRVLVPVITAGTDLPESPTFPIADEHQVLRGNEFFQADPSAPPGLAVKMVRSVPSESVQVSEVEWSRIAKELARETPPSPVDELIRLEEELLQLFHHCESREDELIQVNRELEETNRAVLSLYNELEVRAESLRQAGEMKTRFLSNVSHELRTPLAAILSLTQLLMDRVDGELTIEQGRQVSFISQAAGDLAGLVNDLIDLARLHAGHEDIRMSEVQMPELFAILRGMFRPLLTPNSAVTLVFDDPAGLPLLWTDQAKLTQILHNFLSNALKFTRQGEIRVSAKLATDDSVVVSVEDTGIGIDSNHLGLVFEEFGQIESPLQRLATRTGLGLGLPMARKLAKILGGQVDVKSEPGLGSTFTVTIPIRSPDEPPAPL